MLVAQSCKGYGQQVKLRGYVVAVLKCANIILVVQSRAADKFANINYLIKYNYFIFVQQP